MDNETTQNPNDSQEQPSESGDQRTDRDARTGQFVNPLEYRYTHEDVQKGGLPEWVVGRTPKEVGSIAQEMYNSFQGAQPPQSRPQYQASTDQLPSREPATMSDAPQRPTQDMWVEDPARAATLQEQYNDWKVEQRLNSQLQQQQQFNRSLARSSAQQQFPTEFKRWGPEIDLLIQNYNITDMAGMTEAVNVVRGRHADELAAEKAEALVERKLKEMMESGQVVRSGGGGAGQMEQKGLDLDIDNLPPKFRSVFERSGMNADTLKMLLPKVYPNLQPDEALKKWLEKAQKGDILIERGL